MGMREEIENLKSVCCGLISRDEVLDIIDKHAAPVVDMTTGMQPRQPLSAAEELPAWRRELGRLRNMCGACVDEEQWAKRDRVWRGCNARLETLEKLDALRRVILSGKGEAVVPIEVARLMTIKIGGHHPAGKWAVSGGVWVHEGLAHSNDSDYILSAIDSYANSLIAP